MALPFLLSLGLPALGAATGMAASPLLLSGIGAGLGSFLQTGDVGKGIQTGLIAGLGGKLMSSATSALGSAGAQASTQTVTAGGLPAATGSKFLNAALGKDLLAKKLGETTVAGALGAAGSGFGTGLIADAMNPPTFKMSEKEKVDIPPPMPRIRSYQPKKNMDSTAEEEMITYYNPMQAGIMTNASTNYAKGGTVSEEMNEKDVIVEAVKAIKGLSDAPEVALGIFLSEYGEEALRDLVEKVQSGALDDTIERFANGDKGMVEGMGDGSGEDDMIPATMDGEQDVLLTEGEFVMRQPTTKAIQDEFGSEFLDIINQSEDKAPEKIREMVGVEG
tara:strand:+ start:343 stop:1344 length:1002 start_codon:yes stop_codon:yes gene_type:complete